MRFEYIKSDISDPYRNLALEEYFALVKKLDDMIKLPSFLEPFDGQIIGFFVDLAVAKLNNAFGHSFGVEPITQTQESEIANSIEIPSTMADGLKDAVVKE